MSTHHTIDYIEFPVRDLAAAKKFYGAAFGWQFNDYGPEYAGIKGAPAKSAACTSRTNRARRGRSSFCIRTTSKKASRPCKQAGGKILLEPYAVSRRPAVQLHGPERRARGVVRGLCERRRGVVCCNVKIGEVRRLALALPEATRRRITICRRFACKGKIFATVAPDGSFMNVFVGDEAARG